MSFVRRHMRQLVLLLGAAISVAGTLGSAAWIAPVSERLRELADERDTGIKQVQELSAAEYGYFIANQQGDLIYILKQQDGARADLATSIAAGNLLDRETPIRTMIGALALAKVLDYRVVWGEYEKLNEAARKELSWERFSAVKELERRIVMLAQKLVGDITQRTLAARAEINAAEGTLRFRNAIALALSVLGTCVLVAASLVQNAWAERGES